MFLDNLVKVKNAEWLIRNYKHLGLTREQALNEISKILASIPVKDIEARKELHKIRKEIK